MRISKHYRPEVVASKDADRFNLTDPYLDARAARVVATDGRMLVALPVETDKQERSRYLSVHLLKAARSLGEEDAPAEIEDQEIRPFGVLWPAEQMGREFPQWKKALPSFRAGGPGTITLALDAKRLKALADAMGTGGHVLLTLEPGRPAEDPGPILVQPLSPRAKEMGVLMPMRPDGVGDVTLDPGQACPVCRKLLAAGAKCPEHGDPATAQRAELTKQADEILKNAGDGKLAAKELQGEAVARKKGGSHG